VTAIGDISLSSTNVTVVVVDGSITMAGGTLTLARSTCSGRAADINSGGTLTLSSTSVLAVGASTCTVTVFSGGTLAVGPSALVNGAGLVDVRASGNLRIGSPDGFTTGTLLGNIRTTGLDLYDTAANYMYNGTGNQFTGDALPTALTGDFTVNNTGGNVTLTNSLSLNGVLGLTSGDLVTAANTLTQTGTSGTNGTTQGRPTSLGRRSVAPASSTLARRVRWAAHSRHLRCRARQGASRRPSRTRWRSWHQP
jgi:hypothetical protein